MNQARAHDVNAKPFTRAEVDSIKVGSVIDGYIGRPSPVVSIFAKENDVHGKLFVCGYQKHGDSGGSISFSIKEGDTLSRLGVLAYHPSLLPTHRGRDAVRWAIHMRERVTGGTVYWMDEGVDTGPVEDQDFCHILPGETPTELWRRALAPLGLRLLTETVARLAAGGQPRMTPQDARVATFEPAFGVKKLAQD